MKATILFVAFVVLAAALVAAEPSALATGLTVATAQATHAPEPAWMLLSGAALLGAASAVRRFVP